MNDYFSYNDGAGIVPSNAFRISASQISRFFDETSQWYREFLLGETGFTGSTASELGNCVHAAAAMYHDNQSIDNTAIEKYINTLGTDIDKELIRYQYPIMVSTLQQNYLTRTKATDSEMFAWKEILPGIGVGGSIDRYDRHRATISDYKTMGSLDKARVPKTFPRAYWFQQMTYAWLLKQQGLPVDYIELVYVTRSNTGRYNDKGKPLKDYPSEVHVLREPVTTDNLKLIEGCIRVIADSVQLWNDKPELRHILAQDYRLKSKPKPTLFKD